MVYKKITCALLLVFFNLTCGESVEVDQNDYLQGKSITPVGRFYSVTTCNYNAEPGYMCIGCKRALHCYPTNLAILVDCNGVFRPYCYDGHCSVRQGSKCFTEEKKSTPAPTATNVTLDLTTPAGQEIIKLTEANEVASRLFEANGDASKLPEANDVDSKLPEVNDVASKLPEANEEISSLKIQESASNLTEDNKERTDSKFTKTNDVHSPS